MNIVNMARFSRNRFLHSALFLFTALVMISLSIYLYRDTSVGFYDSVIETKSRLCTSGTATSGRQFTGVKTRTFPARWVRFANDAIIHRQIQSSEKLSWSHHRPCPKWSVTTTVIDVTLAMTKLTQLPDDWCMVIVGDRKGLQEYPINEGKQGRIIYLNVKDQEELEFAGVKLSKQLPWNSFGRRNLGYLYAIASGAKLIWDFDDDNALISVPPHILEPAQNNSRMTVLEAKQKVNLTCNSFNPMPLMGAKTLLSWPRGLPLLDIKAPACQADTYSVHRVSKPAKKIGVFQSLANHDPDVDAIYRLTQPLPFDFRPVRYKLPLLVPEGAYSPFNAQGTLFTYEAMFMLILPVTVHERVADIWRAYFGQRLLKDIGSRVVFTHAQVVHNRNDHNYLADFDSEYDLYMKSGKLIEHLKGWSSNCKSLECRFESLIISLYERNYLEIGDVELIQTWIESLHDVGYQFSPLMDTPDHSLWHAIDALREEPKWPDLQLFVPVFPGGEDELCSTLLRSLRFFWPKSKLKLLFLVDEEDPQRDVFSERLITVASPFCASVSVESNSVPKEVWTHGYDRQQLIMLWADNFTNAEYVGFMDDDTLVTNHVMYEDLFDERKLPNVIGQSIAKGNVDWERVAQGTKWIYGGQAEVMKTMAYFPVVVKTAHLKDIRKEILSHHPEFQRFDDLFRFLVDQKISYSQFNIMHHYLWHHKRDEYAWHLEATSARDSHFRNLCGVTEEMMVPKPRCALHLNYDARKTGDAKAFIDDVMLRGFCYSLTEEEYAGDEKGARCTKARYSWQFTTDTTNTDQWLFEHLDWRWDHRTLEAHKERHALNRIKPDWDQTELSYLFQL